MKRVTLDNKMYNLISEEEYLSNTRYYNDEQNVAIEYNGMALPLSQNQYAVGVYGSNDCPLIKYNIPEDQTEYLLENNNLIDFTNVNNIAEYYQKSIEYNDAERDIMTTVTNQFKPVIKEADSPLLKLTKETICSKNIDINNYSNRFPQFNNDKRLLTNQYQDITMKKAAEMLSNLDVDVYTITTNTNPDIPNPMPEPIIRKITGNGEEVSIDEMIKLLKGE